MALSSGDRFGVYEITGNLGEGGMGKVFRARDTKLGRDVALKVLPDLFAQDPDRLARFEREAQALAALNHSNIAHVYGFEQVDEVRAIAMELVEGPTLADRIGEGPIPLEEALTLSRQIAEALEAAHDKGIIHRDLKPANVKMTESGTVKVLDFGLAKVFDPVGEASASAANSPTLTARATQLGMILGTAAYMAPEQAKGKTVDKRADIWAFGVVLFEMLTGRRVFDGEDISDVMASVLKSEPDWDALPADTPPAVRRLLTRCLQKDPKKRLRDVGEGVLQLDEGLSAPPTRAASSTSVGGSFWRRATAAVAMLAVGLAAGAWLWSLWGSTGGPSGLVRFSFVPAGETRVVIGPALDLAMSPDGSKIIYNGLGADGTLQLFVRQLDQLDAAPLRGASPAASPFVSPDGQWVGFTDPGSRSISKVSILGGPPVRIVGVSHQIGGADWGADGTIVFGGLGSGLLRIGEGGGETESITTLEAGQSGHYWPSIIPGRNAIVFVAATGAPLTSGVLTVLDLGSGDVRPLDISGSKPKYLSTGHVVYAAVDGSLMAVPFDANELVVAGNPVPVVEGVFVKSSGVANYGVSDDGRFVYMPGAAGVVDRLMVWVDRDGQEEAIPAPSRSYTYARVSPDGRRIALDIRDQEEDAWIWDLERATLTRLTFDASSDQYAIWTHDGQGVVFSSTREGGEIFRRNADGTGGAEVLTEASSRQYPSSITPDGSHVVFREAADQQDDILTVSLDGDHEVELLLGTEHRELNGEVSPDGRWLAYESNASGAMEIYVRPYPDVDAGRWQVSTAGGNYPVWSPDGRELFYVDVGRQLMAVPVSSDPTFIPGTPQVLFDVTGYFWGAAGRNYDVSRDGQRFVLIKDLAVTAEGDRQMTVILNWFEDVRHVR